MSTESDQNRLASDAPRSRLRSLLTVTVVLLLGLLAAAGIKSYRGLNAARSHEAELEQRILETEARLERLDRRLEHVRNNPATLERLAREELGMVRPGDVVIILPAEASQER